MNLLVNLTPLLTPLTGVGHYTHQLMRRLVECDEVEYATGFFADNQRPVVTGDALRQLLEAADKGAPGAGSGEQRQPPLRRILAQWVPEPVKRLRRSLRRNVQGPLRAAAGQIYWEPNYVLAPFDGPVLPTIHDLSHIRFPDHHPAGRLAWLNEGLQATLSRAPLAVAVSEFTAGELGELFGVERERIRIVSPAPGERFYEPVGADQLVHLRAEYGLPDRFVLSVGTLEPRKNLPNLVAAWQQVPAALRRAIPLVLAGASGWGEGLGQVPGLDALLKRGEVILLGYVPAARLPALYAAAEASVYVSKYEGFGMPVVESQAAGTPVVTSNVASMPEAAGGAALLVDPADPVAIGTAIARILEDQVLANELAGAGRARAAKLSWDQAARRLVAALREVSV